MFFQEPMSDELFSETKGPSTPKNGMQKLIFNTLMLCSISSKDRLSVLNEKFRCLEPNGENELEHKQHLTLPTVGSSVSSQLLLQTKK